MLEQFKHIPGLDDLCAHLDMDENVLSHLIFLIGSKSFEPKSAVDILIECNMLESKSRLRKNPQQIRMGNLVINPEQLITEDCVLSIGKNSGFKCIYIKIIKQ